MYFGYAVLGLIVGVFAAASGGSFLFGAIGGAALGMALARMTKLERRVGELEWKSNVTRRDEIPERATPVEPDRAPATPATETRDERPGWPAPEAETAWAELEPSAATDQARPEHPEAEETEAEPVSKPLKTPYGWPAPRSEPTGPDLAERAARKVAAWFTTGNVPVKVGVIVTFIGVSFLLKYAIDRELILFPLEFRLLAVAAAGLALTVVGWRLREKKRVYALSLQGGGVGILFLTIFTAYRIWALLPAPLAFALLVVLTLATGALAVLQNSRTLAIFGVVGGFLAPILASTGAGSHVALFSYYLVLNGAILGIAWFRAWRELNLVGFAFTFVIGSFWGYQYYRPDLMASTMPFLLLHFLFYNAIAILYARRQVPERIGIVDGTLVFGTPVIASALQAALVQDTDYGLAISAAAAALFYALAAVWLFRDKGEKLRLLTESFMALAVAFGTLAIPLALDARWTSAAWALEGAALVWVGARQDRLLARYAGVALVFFAGAAFIGHGWRAHTGLPILNGNALGGVLIALSALFASRRFEGAVSRVPEPLCKLTFGAVFLWGIAWWVGTGLAEIIDQVQSVNEASAFVLFLAISAAFAAWLGQVRDWIPLRLSSLAFLPLFAAVALFNLAGEGHFLEALGWLAWPLAWAVQAYLLKVADGHADPVAAAWHFGSVILLAGMLALESAWWTARVASDAWAAAAAVSMAGIVALLSWRFRERPGWPVPAHPVTYLNASLVLVALQVILLAIVSVDEPGDPAPLAYIPVLNPFDLAMLFAMATSVLSLAIMRRTHAAAEYRMPYQLLLAAAFFVMTTAALVRAVHFYAGVPWDGEALAGSVIVQTSLSIYWGLLGFAGMIWGARRKQRMVWLVGAGFMALVVIKLFLVDLGNTGTVERIISFIGIGALLLVVGYFAPAPPRKARQGAGAGIEDVEP